MADFRDYVKYVNMQAFTASESDQESFGAQLVNFYADYFVGTDKRNDFTIMKNVDAILKTIRSGAKQQIKGMTRR